MLVITLQRTSYNVGCYREPVTMLVVTLQRTSYNVGCYRELVTMLVFIMSVVTRWTLPDTIVTTVTDNQLHCWSKPLLQRISHDVDYCSCYSRLVIVLVVVNFTETDYSVGWCQSCRTWLQCCYDCCREPYESGEDAKCDRAVCL